MSLQQQHQKILNESLGALRRSLITLQYSYETCSQIQITSLDALSFQELDHLEALCSRFGRISDMLMKKVWKTYDLLELHTDHSNLDILHRAEKRGWIDSSDEFYEMRLLRNQISHDYATESLYELFQHVIQHTPTLITSIERTLESLEN